MTTAQKLQQPKRIQRKRTNGWKMPAGAIYVGRPTKWGNPYSINEWGIEKAMELFANTAMGIWSPSVADKEREIKYAYELHCSFLSRFSSHPQEDARAELRGKDLACWCLPDQPCHADILLEIANS